MQYTIPTAIINTYSYKQQYMTSKTEKKFASDILSSRLENCKKCEKILGKEVESISWNFRYIFSKVISKKDSSTEIEFLLF